MKIYHKEKQRVYPKPAVPRCPGHAVDPNRPPSLPYTVSLSPLERFLGSVFIWRKFPQFVHPESSIPLRSIDPNVSSFRVEMLQFHLAFKMNVQSLHMNVQAKPENWDQWSMEASWTTTSSTLTLKVAFPPYKINAIQNPGDSNQNPASLHTADETGTDQASNMKRYMERCLTVQLHAAFVALAGTAAAAKKPQINLLLMMQLLACQNIRSPCPSCKTSVSTRYIT